MDKDMERVGGEVGEVADTQFFQTADQGLTTGAGPGRKPVGLVFVASGKGIDADSEQHRYRGIQETKEHQPGMDGDMLHSKGGEQSRIV